MSIYLWRLVELGVRIYLCRKVEGRDGFIFVEIGMHRNEYMFVEVGRGVGVSVYL